MLIALVCTFALPAVIAKVILTQGWYQSGVTNRGELVEPYTTLEQLGQESPLKDHGWQLAYVLPNECTEQCKQQLYLLQEYASTGRQEHIRLRSPYTLSIRPTGDQYLLLRSDSSG